MLGIWYEQERDGRDGKDGMWSGCSWVVTNFKR